MKFRSIALAAAALLPSAAFGQFALDGTIVQPVALPGEADMAPNLSVAPDGSVWLSWLTAAPAGGQEGARQAPIFRLQAARLAQGQWQPVRTIMQRSGVFANWADIPSITQHPDGTLLAHWLQKSGPGTYAYDVMLARSTDGGETWRELGPAHDDGTQTEHGFVAAVPDGNGIRLFWLDGREMTPEGEDGHGEGDSHGHGHGAGSMELRTALITDTVGESVVLDARVCECCGTSAAMTDAGPIIAYRDRAEGEVRDISIVRFVDGEWTKPVTIHDDGWEISGCPVNGPAIAASGRHVAAAWFTAANVEPRVLLAWSSDGGATFGEPIVLDDRDPHGRVDIAIDESGHAVVCWMAAAGENAKIVLASVSPDGAITRRIVVGETAAGRASGFPKIARTGDGWLVVWTDPRLPRGESAQRTRLRAAVVSCPSE